MMKSTARGEVPAKANAACMQVLLNQSCETLQGELWRAVLQLSPSVPKLFSDTLVRFLSSVPWLSRQQAASIAASAAASVKAATQGEVEQCLRRTLDDVRCIKPAATTAGSAIPSTASMR